VLKKWVAVAVLQLRLRLCGVGVWVYIETCQKKCRKLRVCWGFAFVYYYVLRLLCDTIWEENMWRSSWWSRD
jgi:hypothetical protein